MSWSAACQRLIVCTFLLQVAAGQGPATRREPGEACGFSIECCAGCTCESRGGAKTCVRGDSTPSVRPHGDTCSDSAQCCAGCTCESRGGAKTCVRGDSTPPVAIKKGPGDACRDDDECCRGCSCGKNRKCVKQTEMWVIALILAGIFVFICGPGLIYGIIYGISACCCAKSDEASGDAQDIEAATHAPDSHPSDDTVVASHAPDYLSSCDVADAVSVASTPPDEDATNAAPPHMVCPISLAVMKDPCRCGDGHHNFERSYLLRHLRTNKPACPVSRIAMTADDVVSNEELKAEITEWLAEDLAAGNPVSVSAPEQHAPTNP